MSQKRIIGRRRMWRNRCWRNATTLGPLIESLSMRKNNFPLGVTALIAENFGHRPW